jgi:hypothetical protein
VEQELHTLPEHLSSPPVFSGVPVTRSLGLYVCFVDRCLSFCTFSFGHWRFTLILIKISYGQIGDETGLFYTTNPVFYTDGNRFARRTGTFGNL